MDPEINPFQAAVPTQKKRVLVIITQSEFGGAQQFIFQFLKNADKDKFSFDVAVGHDGDGSFTRAMADLNIPVFTVENLRRDVHPLADLKAIPEIRRLIATLKPDTLFLNSSKAGFVGALAARGFGSLNVVYRIGGWTFNDPWPKWRKWLWIKLEQFSAGWKDWVIVNNSRDLAQAKELGIKPRRGLLMVHNGIDPYKLELLSRDQARNELLKMMPAAELQPKYIVGCLANFYPAKGLEYLIEAAEQTADPNIIFCIIGDGPERHNLEQRIRQKSLDSKVFLAGRIEQASRYLSAFDVFVLPSVKEGFPWAVLEAMSAKLPVIATRVGAVSEIIENGTSGYIVEPRDPSQIADRITTILNNESKAQEMGIQAHQRVLFAFNIETTIRQIEKVL